MVQLIPDKYLIALQRKQRGTGTVTTLIPVTTTTREETRVTTRDLRTTEGIVTTGDGTVTVPGEIVTTVTRASHITGWKTGNFVKFQFTNFNSTDFELEGLPGDPMNSL